MSGRLHESFAPRMAIRQGSARSFGWVMGTVGLLLGLLLLRPAPLLAALFALIGIGLYGAAWRRPTLLEGANRLWLRLGLWLGRILDPLLMALVYFLVLTPVAILFRRRNRDAVQLGFDARRASYWIERRDGPRRTDWMTRQF